MNRFYIIESTFLKHVFVCVIMFDCDVHSASRVVRTSRYMGASQNDVPTKVTQHGRFQAGNHRFCCDTANWSSNGTLGFSMICSPFEILLKFGKPQVKITYI